MQILWLRWLKSDVTKRASAEKDGTAKRLTSDERRVTCTTLVDCFAKFTQQEEVTVIVA